MRLAITYTWLRFAMMCYVVCAVTPITDAAASRCVLDYGFDLVTGGNDNDKSVCAHKEHAYAYELYYK